MPTVIRVGSKVSGAVGPLLEPVPGQARRRRVRFDGIVIRSAENQRWTVYWRNISQACDHPSQVLRLVSSTDAEENLRRLNVSDILQNRLIDNIDSYLASWQQQTTPVPQPRRDRPRIRFDESTLVRQEPRQHSRYQATG